MKARAVLAVLAALAVTGAAATAFAQNNETGSEPTLDESDFDTEPPQEDESYLDDEYSEGDGSGSEPPANESGDEPTLTEDDFDVSEPAFDASWLDDENDLDGTGAEDADDADTGSTSGTDDGASQKRTPGPGVIGALAALGGLAVGVRRPNRPKA